MSESESGSECSESESGGVELKPEFESLTELIKENEYPGDFFCSGVLPAIPEIQFDDNTTYLDPSFPKESDCGPQPISIKDLIKKCSQAPFGRNEETVVDTNVRKCWQLDPDKFTLRNSFHFSDVFVDLKQSVCGVLAPGLHMGHFELKLYKLLVYEKGSFFLPHRDTQRDENHFGTLILSLPVKHTGGALHVRHMGDERIHKMEPGRVTKQCQWAAFFTDVEHEVKKITSGHRITLVYNLYRSGSVKLEPPVSSGEHPIVKSLKKIQDYLRKIDSGELEYVESDISYPEWTCEPESLGVEQYSHAGYILEHKYTPVSLKPKNLKGRDAFLYQLLSAAGFELRLVAMEVQVDSYGWCDDNGRYTLKDLDEDQTLVTFSELDTSAPTVSGSCSGGRGKTRQMFPSRPMDEVTWLVENIAQHAKALRRVEKHIEGLGNEGSDWHSTYLSSALVINLMPGKKVKREYSMDHTLRGYPYLGT